MRRRVRRRYAEPCEVSSDGLQDGGEAVESSDHNITPTAMSTASVFTAGWFTR